MLADLLRTDLDVIFCGTSVADRSAAIGHYYAGPGNEFWTLLADSGVTSRRLSPKSDADALECGIGLTDLVKGRSSSNDSDLVTEDFDVPAFVEKIGFYRPRWVAFHGKTAARVYRGVSSSTPQPLGTQPWRIAAAKVYVVPSASGSNRRSSYDGLSSRLEWFRLLREELVVESTPE